MSKLFDLDGPVFTFLARVFDLMVVNFLFLICCIPVVTIGAAKAAMFKVCQDIVFDEDNGIPRRFFQAFRDNFKQSTVVWICEAVFIAGMACNWLLILSYFTGGTATVLKALVLLLTALGLSFCAYLYPLIVRYDNTLWQHFRNSMVLSIMKLPRTIAMLLLNTLPFWLFYFSAIGFLKTLVFWAVIGLGFIAYMDSHLIRPIFIALEKQDDPEEDSESSDAEDAENS